MSLPRFLLRLVLGRRLPVTSGELRLRGPLAPITIRRDKFGIPHAEAESEADALFALGFCQGQDRAGQLEVLQRVVRGRLAEWVGSAGLSVDRMSRRIGFWRSAEKQLPVLAESVRNQLIAFAAGISAGNSIGLSNKPHEFALIGGEPTAWTATDVLAMLKLQSYLLPSNWDVELARLRILLADGPDAVRRLEPGVAPVSAPEVALASGTKLTELLASDLAALQVFLPQGGGSNNWAIAGSRTASGKPILASDPHLAPSVPAPWYLAHVRCPEWEAAGAAFVGAPGFGIGHNGFAAWGVTAGLTDNTDLYLETLGPDRRSVRSADGTFTPCEQVHEVIHVKGSPDVTEEVLLTPRGPIITPVLDDIPHAISLRAVWLDPLPVDGFLGMVRARSFAEFREPFEHWPLFPLNMLYADAAGAIGWQLIGQLPRRIGHSGLLPVPADRPGVGWDGLVPFDEMPFIENPDRGYLATANNDPLEMARGGRQPPAAYELGALTPPARQVLGADYCDPYRVRAITDALAARTGWTPAECLALQQDVRCLPWEEVRDVVLSLTPDDPNAREGLALLRDWNGRVESESPAACVFELFVAELCNRVARAAAPKAWLAALGETGLGTTGHNLFTDRRVGHLMRLVVEQPDGWFKSWPDEMVDALTSVVKKLRREVGPAPAYWAWGHLRRLRLDHPLFAKHRWLGPVFNLGPVPCGGDCNTISQAGVRPAEPTSFTHNMANMRTVFDLADLSRSLFVLCGGQSGNPCSPHYADQLPLWQAGEAISIAWDQMAVIREAKQTLRLLPV